MKLRAAVVAVVLGWAASAHADTPPSVWDRAKDPDAADDFAVHEMAMGRMASLQPDRTDDGSFISPAITMANEGLIRGLIAMLKSAGAETGKHPLLRFDLAQAYAVLGQRLSVPGAFEHAAALYKAALADFPDDPRADDGWDGLADACAHTADRECEMKAWREVLQRETEPSPRLTPLLNLAEVEMHDGDLKSAIEGYREAFNLASRVPSGHATDIGVLAEYGLAVALDRAGEINEAEHHAKMAVSMEQGAKILHGPGTYFVPAYEINWYDAVTAASLARAETNPKLRLAYWTDAVDRFTKYVKAGEPAKDRWLPIAKAHLALYVVERAKAEKQFRAAPPPAPEPDALELLIPGLGPPPVRAPPGPAPKVHAPSGSTILHL